MSIENKNSKESLPWTPRAKKLAAGLALTAAGGAVVAGAAKLGAEQQPDFHGHQIVVVDKDSGGSLDVLVKHNVEGGRDYTGAVRIEVKNDPDNADVFEDGILSEGEEIEMPEKVTN